MPCLRYTPRPFVAFLGPNVICQGSTSQLTPTFGGIWTTSNESVAPVGNNGVITGIGAGTASFTFINSTTGCESNIPLNITVNPKPIVILPQTQLCKQDSMILPSLGAGAWISLNPSIASINTAGKVFALSQGLAMIQIYLCLHRLCI